MTATRGERVGPVVLCILDGWGYREERDDNAVALAAIPVFDRYWQEAPHCFLRTDGPAVGLPEGQFGNSEVGHMNLGAGRVVVQELPRINRLIETGALFEGEAYRRFVGAARGGSGRVHLLGLVSPGGVHAHQDHVAGLARALVRDGLEVLIHAFLDGRDTPPRSAEGYLDRLMTDVDGDARVVSVSGRYYAMDRDRRWDRTLAAFEAIVAGKGRPAATPQAAVAESYAEGVGDEFVVPRPIKGYAGFEAGDAVLCANFRADRVRQIMGALVAPGFDGFEHTLPDLSAVAGMTGYSADLDAHMSALVEGVDLHDILGEMVAKAGLKQLRAAETEKYPHVTFFFNGGAETPFSGEERVLVPSPKVATYDLQPEMSAPDLTERLCDAIDRDAFDFVLVNYANPDMVGHTGKLDAAIKAVETVDACLGRVVAAALAKGGRLIVTADHGNCEVMRNPKTGEPHTAHTLNPVPCMLIGAPPGTRLRDGRLADVAPSVLALLGLDQPAAMEGRSLIEVEG